MVLNILMRSLGFFVVATVTYLSLNQGLSLFVWHPILMSVGFILLSTEAVIAFTSNSYVARNLKHSDKVNAHWALNATSTTLIGIAFWSIYSNKNNNGYDHFASSHAKNGLNTLLLVAGTTCGGLAARYNAAFRSVLKPAHLKLIHSLFGALTYSFAMYTYTLGLESDWFRSKLSVQWINLLTYAVWLMAFLALIKPFISITSKARNSLRVN